MLTFAAARARQTAIVAVFVTSLAFMLIHLAPGDPLATSLDESPELTIAREALRTEYGLDRPLYVQYPVMVGNMLRGRFGISFSQSRPVSEVLAAVLPRTILLMAPALLIGVLVGTALGTWQGARAGRLFDRLANGATLGVLAIPEFVLALLVATIFGVRLRWFPATGMMDAGAVHVSWLAMAGDVARHATLPVATLAAVIASMVARYQRAAVIEALREDFVRAARARGAPELRVLFRHVLRRTAGSLLTVVGLLFPVLVGGAALVELVFSWPGAGSALLGAVLARDYPLVIALVLVGSVAVSIGSAIADIAGARANPATSAIG